MAGLLVCSVAIGCGNGGAANGDGGSGGGGAAGGGGGGSAGGGGTGGGGPHDFPSTAVWYQDISGAPLDAENDTVMAALQSSGWGGTLGIDTSFAVLSADASVTPRPFMPTSQQQDCDTAPIPVPAGGHIEGETDYHCSSGGDCHLLVYQGTRLYELYQADITGGMATGGTFTGNCLVIWDLTKDYWVSPSTVGANFSRGDGCNGADAGDMPMAALILKTADIQSGTVDHAMRFTLPNSHIRADVYLHPATHLGGPSGGATTLPYGARLRLKASYDASKLSPAGQIVAAALKKYGMFLADGGNPYISATDDIASVISPSVLRGLMPSDFEWVDSGGPLVNINQESCMRTPITQ